MHRLKYSGWKLGIALILCFSTQIPVMSYAAESFLTIQCEGEQFRDSGLKEYTRSAVEVGVSGSYDDGIRFHTSLDLRGIADSALPERDRVFIRDAAIGIGLESVEFTIGRRILSTGRLDVLQPTNVFLRRDLTDPIENCREPLWMAETALYIDRATATFTWIPLFEPDILSWETKNPWRLFPKTINTPGIDTFKTEYRHGKRIEPSEDLRSSEFALQCDWYAGRFDLGIVAAKGFSRLPTWFETDAITEYPDERVVVELDTVHRPITVMGGDFAYVWGSTTFRAEMAYTWVSIPPDRPEENAYLTGGISADYTFSETFLGKYLSLSAQYNFDGASRQMESYVDYQHFFRHAGFFRCSVEPAPDFDLTLEAFINVVDTDNYLNFELAWSPIPGLRSSIGAVSVNGPDDSFLGVYRENDRIRIALGYTWTTVQ